MTPARLSLINALTLIIMGFWGYSDVSSPTALIPVGFGVVILIASIVWIKKPALTKIVAHIAILFTLIILSALVGMRLPKSLATGGVGLVRVIAMISTSVLAITFFIKNFIDNRKNM